MFFPIYLNLENKRVVVIGGGEVAERKVASLSGSGAMITIISPEVTSELAGMADDQIIELKTREYVPGDCTGAALVLSATDDPEVSRLVWEEASAAGIFVNTADQPAFCDFIMPAVVRRGCLAIAISTSGRSPALAARLREEVSEILTPEYAQLAELLAQVRSEIRQRIHHEEDRKALHYRIVDSDIIACLKKNDSTCAARRLREIIEDFVRQEKIL